MILDSYLQLTTATTGQALTGTALSTNTIDLGAANKDISIGEPLVMVINVATAADYGSSNETYVFDFVQSANANLSSSDSLVSRTITAANLTAGSTHIIPIPPGSITKRYIGGNFTLGGTTPSVTIHAFVQPASMIQMTKPYADAITIS